VIRIREDLRPADLAPKLARLWGASAAKILSISLLGRLSQHARTTAEYPAHQGLILHAIYHRPNGWDHVPPGSKIPRGEACLWGDYHAREAALLVQREIDGGPWPSFFGPAPGEPPG
jgi:hypothetical protein